MHTNVEGAVSVRMWPCPWRVVASAAATFALHLELLPCVGASRRIRSGRDVLGKSSERIRGCKGRSSPVFLPNNKLLLVLVFKQANLIRLERVVERAGLVSREGLGYQWH